MLKVKQNQITPSTQIMLHYTKTVTNITNIQTNKQDTVFDEVSALS